MRRCTFTLALVSRRFYLRFPTRFVTSHIPTFSRRNDAFPTRRGAAGLPRVHVPARNQSGINCFPRCTYLIFAFNYRAHVTLAWNIKERNTRNESSFLREGGEKRGERCDIAYGSLALHVARRCNVSRVRQERKKSGLLFHSFLRGVYV